MPPRSSASPAGTGRWTSSSRPITLIQTLKIEPFPVILFGSGHWGGLVDWIRKTLPPHFINAEDVDIFRVVDTPEEAVRLVKEGIGNTGGSRSLPRAPAEPSVDGATRWQARTARSGEGTRYGQRPSRPGKRHLDPPARPQQ